MIKNKNKILPFLKKLKFNVYVIGYKGQGESIVFTLENDYSVIYSGVIDCFEKENINETINLLKNKLNIEKLDILCWTHPHEDHTKGMDKLINSYTSEKTKLVYPANIYNVKQENEHMRKTSEILKEIILSQKHKKQELYPINGYRPIDRRQLGNQLDKSYELNIVALTPVSSVLEKRILQGKENTPNDYSISLLVSIGGVSFLFSGDIQDITIKKIDTSYLPDKIDYVKIPHHSSKHSLSLLNWFSKSNKSSISCTTEYSISNLPDKGVIDKYKLYFNEIYFTNEKSENDNGLGIVHTVYDVTGNSFFTSVEKDAYAIHKNNINIKSKKL